MSTPAYLLLGKIIRPHGIKGEVRAIILTDYPDRIHRLDTIYLSKDPESKHPKAYHIESSRIHQGYFLIKFIGIDERNDAERLREFYIMVDIDNAVPLEADEIYLYQLIGLHVQLQDGQKIGILTDIMETGANYVYLVMSERYGEVLIPATQHTIIETDLNNKRLIVKLPEGLLPST